MPDDAAADSTSIPPNRLIGHAIAGLLLGGMLWWTFLRAVLGEGSGWLAACAVAGAIGGAIYGWITEQRAMERRQALSAEASREGAQFSPVDAGVLADLRSDFPQQHLGMQNVLRKEVGGLPLVLGELSITTQTGDREGGTHTSTTTQTAVYYRAPELNFPRYRIQAASWSTKLLRGATGFQGLRFEDAAFAKDYFVLATDAAQTPLLIDAEVRAWLLAHRGLGVESGGAGIVIYRPGELQDAQWVEGFMSDAAQLVRLLTQPERLARAQAAAKDDLRAFTAQMPASMARSIEKQMQAAIVTREQVDAFVRQAPPRKIPANIANSYGDKQNMALFGFVFFAVGGLMAALFAGMNQWGGVAFLSLFVLTGGALLFFGVRGWWRQRSLLRHGEIAAATIEAVESTGVTEDPGGEVFNVSLGYAWRGQSMRAQCKVSGAAGHDAKRLAAERKAAAILCDPAHPERVALVAGLVKTFHS